MSRGVYYNENNPYCVAWLRNLIAAGHLPAGDMDSRSISDVRLQDLRGYAQYHFFAGIGGWPLALQLAHWPEDRAVWTGSCPCQPFSVAGQRKGFKDERHLWPEWLRLIGEYRPAIIFGEQVARGATGGWYDLVTNDLEAKGYACGAAILPAVAAGAPHLRQRLWFVAHAQCGGLQGTQPVASQASLRRRSADQSFQKRTMAHTLGNLGTERGAGDQQKGTRGRNPGRSRKQQNVVAHSNGARLAQRQGQAAAEGGWWDVEPDVGRVANGVSARVDKLRALGNAIVPQVAAKFIVAAMKII